MTLDKSLRVINVQLGFKLNFYIRNKIYCYQNGSVIKETFILLCLLFLIALIQALIVTPFTSISQAPQLPVRQPDGIFKPAFSAELNQSSPSETNVSLLFGHITFMLDSFNLKNV